MGTGESDGENEEKWGERNGKLVRKSEKKRSVGMRRGREKKAFFSARVGVVFDVSRAGEVV